MHRILTQLHRALCPLAGLALCTTIAAAQTITGTVESAGQHLPGATVRLLELDRLTHTAADGSFSFLHVPRGTYRVFASVIGHASETRSVELDGDEAKASFDLKVTAIPIEEIVVSASPYPRTADALYQSAESRSQVDFLGSAGASFAEKLSDLPGVTVRGNGSAPARPILRGLSDNRVLVLENGLRNGDIAAYDPAHATPIEAVGVSQVDVVRGPASILYGPSTIGGLVNIITDIVPTLASRAVTGTVAIEGNSVSDLYSGFFRTVTCSGPHAFSVSAGGLHANDIHIPSGTYTDPASGASFALDRMPQTFDHSGEYGVGYSYQGTFGMIGVGGKHFEMNYGIPGVPPNPDWMDVPPATSRIAQKRNTVELRSLVNVGGSWVKQLKINANYNDYNHSEFPTAQDETGISDPQANHFHKREFNGTLQFEQRALGKLQGTLGLWSNIEDMTIDGDQPLGPNSLTTGFAAYGYEEYVASERSRLQAGLRFDYNKIQTNPDAASTDPNFQTLDVSQLSNAVTASLGAIRKFAPELTGSISLARSFRAPTVQELFANGLDAASGSYSIGTAGLKPETGFGVDASLRGNFERFAFEVSPYVNIIQDYIYAFVDGDTLVDAASWPIRRFAATDARLAGFEASATVQPAARLALRASADYVNAQDTKLDVPLPFTPPLRGLLRATYQTSSAMGMIEWRGAARQARLGDGDTPTAGYGIVNLGAGLRLTHSGCLHNISVHCDNVLNRVYRDNLSVVKDFIPQPARGFRINYELNY